MMKRTIPALAALLLAACTLVACGGDDEELAAEAGRKEATTFGAYAASLPASAPAGSPPTAAVGAEVAQRSRQWAVNAIIGASEPNAITAPPLYFGRLQAVLHAAAGDTRAELQSTLDLPSDLGVWAGLMKGLSRTISAASEAAVMDSFMQAASLVGHEGQLAGLVLQPVSAADLALAPNLRLEVRDRLSDEIWVWESAAPFTAPYTDAKGRRSLLSLVRVQGKVSSFEGAGFRAKVLALPGQARLVRISPADAISPWDAATLNAALQETAALAEPTEPGEIVLLAGPQGTAVGLDDTRGLSLAMDPVKSDFKGLDGVGGTYLSLGAISASASIDGEKLSLGGSQGTQFIYSPSNQNGDGVVINTGDLGLKDCSGPAADIAPHFLVLVRDNGSITFLARMALLAGSPCGFILGVAAPSSP